jgi:RNA polymerase primary sigma factor
MSSSWTGGRVFRFPRGRNGKRPRGWNGRAQPESNRALARYLEEVGSTPLLGREKEEQHAATLHEAREAFAALVLELPQRERGQVLNGNPEGPELGSGWRLRELESCHERMIDVLGRSEDPRIARILASARQQKRRIDCARDALIRGNLRFVAHLAKQLAANSTIFSELIQEGNLGLLEAVERFDHRRGLRFSTYAFWWIRKSQHLALASKTRMIYVPSHVSALVGQLWRASSEMTKTLGRAPTADELAERLDLPAAKVRELQAVAGDVAPLEESDDSGNPRGPLGRVADENGIDPLQEALDRELRSKILDSLQVLSPQESLVIRLRFGIGRRKRMTLKQVGRIMDLSRERVRQIELAAVRKLQRSPQARSFSIDH